MPSEETDLMSRLKLSLHPVGQRVNVGGTTWAAGTCGAVDEHTYEDETPLIGVRLDDGRHVLVAPEELSLRAH